MMRKSQQLTDAGREHLLQTALASTAMANTMLRTLCADVDTRHKQLADTIMRTDSAMAGKAKVGN